MHVQRAVEGVPATAKRGESRNLGWGNQGRESEVSPASLAISLSSDQLGIVWRYANRKNFKSTGLRRQVELGVFRKSQGCTPQC